MMTIQVSMKADGDTHDPEATEDFITYRGLLCYHSKFFEKLLTGPFKEGGATAYKLTTCTPQIFAIFYNWMNTGVASMEGDGTPLTSDIGCGFEVAVDLYVFADFHEISALRIHALEICYHFFVKENIGFDQIGDIYDKTAESSSLRVLAVDLLTHICTIRDYERCIRDAPRPDLFLDLIKASHEHKVVPGSAPIEEGLKREEWDSETVEHFCEWYHDHYAPA